MQLQIPICSFDAKTGILCSMCEARLRNGQIREADVQASKALLQLAGRLRGAASLVRSFKVDGNYVLELDQSGLVAFKDNPEALEGLEKLLGGHVWLARASSSDREFIEDLLYPVKVLALGTIWLPDGTKIAKATVAGRTSRRTHPSELIKRIVKEVRGIDVVVESDDENRPRETAAAPQYPSWYRAAHDNDGASPHTTDRTIDTPIPPREVAAVAQAMPVGHENGEEDHPAASAAQPGHQSAQMDEMR